MDAKPSPHAGDDLPNTIPISAAPHAAAHAAPVKRYDFRKPGAVNRGLLHTLRDLHSGFARKFAAGLTPLLRNPTDIHLLGVDHVSLREYLVRLDNPTCVHVLEAETLPEPWLADLQPAVLFPMIDSMLGGSQNGSAQRRPLTDIELRLAARIGGVLAAELCRAWRAVAELALRLARIECNPRSLQPAAPDERAYLLRFGMVFGQRRGMLRLCLPQRALEPLLDRLCVPADDAVQPPPVPENVIQIGRQVRSSAAEVQVWLAESQISAHDLIGLRAGDIIATHHRIDQPVVVAVEGVPKFHARPGAVRGHKAILITEPLNDDA